MERKALNISACFIILNLCCALLSYAPNAVGQVIYSNKDVPINVDTGIDSIENQIIDQEIEIRRLSFEILQWEAMELWSHELLKKIEGSPNENKMREEWKKDPEANKHLEEQLNRVKERLFTLRKAKAEAERQPGQKKETWEDYKRKSKKLKKDISNLYSKIERMVADRKKNEIIVYGIEQTEELWDKISAVKAKLEKEPGFIRNGRSSEEIREEMDKVFMKHKVPITIFGGVVINNLAELEKFRDEALPRYEDSLGILNLSRENVKLLEDRIQEKDQQLILVQKKLSELGLPLVGKWGVPDNGSIVEIRFDDEKNRYFGKLIVNNFPCYNTSDDIIELLLIDENNPYEYSGKKVIYNQRCEKRENRLWISIKGAGDEIELISADRESEYRWHRVDDRPEAPDPSSAPDFDEFMNGQ